MLTEQHKSALEWFRTHRGMQVRWPTPLPDGTFLLNKAKGIHKPAGWKYALSVRQALGGPYADHDPEIAVDGTWSYRYYQEGANPADRDRYFTNRALIANWSDGVPVGVCRQIRGRPEPLYEVLGLAKVLRWEDGYFLLISEPTQSVDASLDQSQPFNQTFDPTNIDDARRRTLAQIVQRQGQAQFREELLRAYGSKCAISACPVYEVLEAAHIIPYKGPDTNKVGNGILLRADLHTLFDVGLISVDGDTFRVITSPKLAGTPYATYEGQRISLPILAGDHPSGAALNKHRRWAGL
jgi:putative restriction endonuclease